jgi:probable biosynthetic protein (TIGR04098 family)
MPAAATEDFSVELGMPHLGRSGLNESALLKMVGHDRWMQFAKVSGVATDKIADAFENRLYATFCFVELLLPPDRPLSAYDENDCLQFSRDLSHYSRIYLDGYYKLKDGGPFSVRCTNVFIYQLAGPQQLKMAQPDNCDFSKIPHLEAPPDSLNLCRAAKAEGTFHAPIPNRGNLGSRVVDYPLDPDRDANGAGLIYFANFVCFLDFAERVLLNERGAPIDLIDARSTFWRQTGYFANAMFDDRLEISITGGVEIFEDRLVVMSFDYRMSRASDGKLVLISAARKSAKLTPEAQSWIARLKEAGSEQTHG